MNKLVVFYKSCNCGTPTKRQKILLIKIVIERNTFCALTIAKKDDVLQALSIGIQCAAVAR